MQAAPADPSSPATPSRGPDDRENNRVPLERQVTLRFEDFEGFVTECSMNISATGMFIRCDDPQPAGSVLDFELSLADGEKLVRGYGEVMWARRHDDGPDHPAGMGVRFLHLDAESRELIRWTVTRRYITGAGPCDLDELKSAMRQAAEDETAAREHSAPESGGLAGIEIPPEPGEERPRPRYYEAGCAAAAGGRQPMRPLRLVLPLAALALGGLYLLRAPSPVDAAAHVDMDEVAATESAAPAAEPAVAAGENPPQPPFSKGGSQKGGVEGDTPGVGAGPASPEVVNAAAAVGVKAASPWAADAAPAATAAEADPSSLAAAWARAWSEQRAADYLACYAADFQPPRGLHRRDWEAQRRLRIAKPRSIEVELSGVTVETLGPDRARVRFRQAYRSETYRDVVRKILELVREDGGWRILEERVASPTPGLAGTTSSRNGPLAP